MRRPPPVLAPAPVDGPYCRNCGSLAEVHFCPVCGQETQIAVPTVRHFVAEFAEQTLALQGQLWRTLLSLLFRPGELTLDYIAGRRQRYVRPLRLYLALSILFFALIGFSSGFDFVQLDADAQADLDRARAEIAADAAAGPTASTNGMKIETGHPEFDRRIKARIDSLLTLPRGEMTDRIVDAFTAWAPVAMFFLMPLFAAVLRLGYLRRGANYAVHLLFAVNFHSFVFLLLLLVQLPVVDALADLLMLLLIAHLTVALRIVHGGGWLATSLFAALLLGVYLVLLAVILVVSTAVPLTLL